MIMKMRSRSAPGGIAIVVSRRNDSLALARSQLKHNNDVASIWHSLTYGNSDGW
ncbi:hypothetical protein [Nostoc sp. CCY0012]|uniref:hypothetical protein n=1 Tax=Nostoc sp. CCY0012 TaxID=1056123 RepID=UPI0039C6D0D5